MIAFGLGCPGGEAMYKYIWEMTDQRAWLEGKNHTRPIIRMICFGISFYRIQYELMLVKFIDSLNSWNSELMAKITHASFILAY